MIPLARVRILRNPRLFRRPHSLQQKRTFSIELIVETLTSSIQQVHTTMGIPWWALIPLTTFSLRGMWTFPLAVLQRLRIQKQTALRPIISATGPVLRLKLAKKALAASQKATQDRLPSVSSLLLPLNRMGYEQIMILSIKEVRRRQKQLFRENGVQIYKNFFLPAAQIPLWVCMSLTFRNVSGWSGSVAHQALDPSLLTEGIFWFTDLTANDPFHIFPVVLGAVALINAEWTFKTLDLMKGYTLRRVLRTTITDALANISRTMVVFLMAVSWHAPTALTLYWLSSQVFSLVQNMFLDLVFPTSFTPKKRVDYRKLRSVEAKDVIVHRS